MGHLYEDTVKNVWERLNLKDVTFYCANDEEFIFCVAKIAQRIIDCTRHKKEQEAFDVYDRKPQTGVKFKERLIKLQQKYNYCMPIPVDNIEMSYFAQLMAAVCAYDYRGEFNSNTANLYRYAMLHRYPYINYCGV